MTRSALPGIVALVLLGTAAHADHPSPYPWTLSTSDFDYDIFFDASNPYDCSSGDDVPSNADGNFISVATAQWMANALDRQGNAVPGFPDGYHPGYVNLGFKAPDFNGEDDEVLVYDCAPREDGPHEDDDCDSGRATFTRIIMPSTLFCSSSERNVRRVMGHELWHHVEQAYSDKFGEWGKVAWEGTARMMEDQVYDDIDGDDTLRFDNEVNGYLGNPNQEFWRSSYRSALGWKYMAEQYGTVTTEPQVGVDFIRQFWENVEANDDTPDLPGTIEQTIQDFSPNTSLREWFHDFTTANLAQQYDASGLPDADKFTYIDNNDGNGTAFAPVGRTWTGSIFSADSAVSAVVRWGASYYEAEGTCIPGWFMGYRARNADDARHALAAVTLSDEVGRLIRGGGEEFAVAFLQPDPPLYNRLVAGITAGDDQIAFSYEFDCGPGSIDIALPTSLYPTFVGPPDDPRNLIVRLRVNGPDGLGGASVVGLQKEDFQVYVGTLGNPADEAQVVGGRDVLGEYWITVKPPAKGNTNTYDLHVSMGGGVLSIDDSSANSVSYEEKLLDQVLVIDRSGSMIVPVDATKLEAAQNAASLFVDISAETDRIGLVSFSSNAVTDATLSDATGTHKDTVKTKLAALTAAGGTSIGDGLDEGADQLFLNGVGAGEDWLVLLSDGVETDQLFWDNVQAGIVAQGVRINTIALGADADQVLLQDIANTTGGQFYFVDANSFRGGSASVANELADVYASNLEAMRGHERLWEVSGHLLTETSFDIEIEGDGLSDINLFFNWEDADDTLDVEILRPDGTPVTDGSNGASVVHEATHVVTQLPVMTAGTWTVNLTADTGSPRYIGILSGRDTQGPELTVQFAQNDDDVFSEIVGGYYLRGLPQPITATLIDDTGAVTGARVLASIEHPDGTVIDLRLSDDGLHGDGAANDGIYANRYTRTTAFSLPDQPDAPGSGSRGSYNVSVTAGGTDNNQNVFNRIRKGTFQVLELDGLKPGADPSDGDMDGMPDRYEVLHDCLDPVVDDAAADEDQNGITNLDEYEAGFDPCHPDTDRGGESDVSERTRGANPFDPIDDFLPRLIDVEIVDYVSEHLDFPRADDLQPNSLLIRYQLKPQYHQMRLLRRSFGPTFTEVAVFDPHAEGGLYRDTGLINNILYEYRLQPIDINGFEGTPSHIISGVPKLDPVPPIGSVLINHGQQTTTGTLVNLSLSASAGTTEVKISNDPNLDDDTWDVFDSPFISWGVDPDPVSGEATVYVQYRDGAGNVSPSVYEDSITVVDGNAVGTITGNVYLGAARGGPVPAEGITLVPDGPGDNWPEFTRSNGFYVIRNLEPGTYDLTAHYPNYESETLSGVVVVQNGTTSLRDIILGAADTDGDGVADIADNCSLEANNRQHDTDADGFGNACDLDLNNDCTVNFLDLSMFETVFFTSDPDADTNQDGTVNFLDLIVMEQLFFGPPGPSGIPTVCDQAGHADRPHH